MSFKDDILRNIVVTRVKKIITLRGIDTSQNRGMYTYVNAVCLHLYTLF